MLSLNVELRLKILWHFKNADTHNYIYIDIYIDTFLWFNISPMTDGYETCHNMSKSNINVAVYQDKL